MAYDALYDIINADVAGWYNSLLPTANDTVTLGQMRFAFTAYFGLTQETISLPNDNFVVHRTIEPEQLSGADIIRYICELEGCFGQINNVGNFKYVVLSSGIDDGLFPSDTLYPANDLYPQDVNHDVTPVPKSRYIDVEFEDYNAESITGLTIRTNDSDVGVTVGSQGNVYVITGNPLVYGCNAATLQTVATNALSNMENRYYRPCTVNALGNPLHEVGDGIRISTTYRGVVTYILERTLSGIQALRDTYVANGEQYYTEKLNSVTSQFKQLANKTTEIKADVDGFKVEVSEDYVSKDGVVTDLNAKMSGINITSNAINIYSTGTFTVDSSNFTLSANGIVTMAGATITGGTITTTGSGSTVTIGNGRVSSGSLASSGIELDSSGLYVAGFGVITQVNGYQISMGGTSVGSISLTCSNSQLLVNGNPVLTGGSTAEVTFGDVTVGTISNNIHISPTALRIGAYSASGTTAEVEDVYGNIVRVWVVS